MKFDLPSEISSIIKVIGVGGGGSNAVNHMHDQGIQGVDFIICNTDKQALDISPVPVKLQLGSNLNDGLGAGSIPERGSAAAQENIEEIRELLGNRTKMVFVTAGMGGGTGTGAAPVIARAARDMGVLTVGIVTMPFEWEGRRRKNQAAQGVEEMRQAVDTLLVINNDRLRDLYGNLDMDQAFAHADNVLTTAARGIAEIINKTGKVNVDFEDVRTVMTGSGVAIMGIGEAEGEGRTMRAAEEALSSPLLNDNNIKGAKYILLNFAIGTKNISMDEMTEVNQYVQDEAGSTADVIWGYCTDESLDDRIRITLIATGFNQNEITANLEQRIPEKKVTSLNTELPIVITAPISSPLQGMVQQAPAPAPESSEPYLKPAEANEVPAQPRLQFEPAPLPARPKAEPAPQETKVVHNLHEASQGSVAPELHGEAPPNAPDDGPGAAQLTHAEHQRRVENRLAHMREMSMQLRTPAGLAAMEREPAFKRRNVELNEGPHSTDSNVSRYTLAEGTNEAGGHQVELRRNNPFLHDNVD
ncbi:MAG TPA: cell division protein FtsZ [Flavobacteriales bacterium]|nr:cell division protein FtsZ [Flavobacteriales bacterium]HRP80806.1 cell division protein FtsZ [Flavobacteriales bacterium]